MDAGMRRETGQDTFAALLFFCEATGHMNIKPSCNQAVPRRATGPATTRGPVRQARGLR